MRKSIWAGAAVAWVLAGLLLAGGPARAEQGQAVTETFTPTATVRPPASATPAPGVTPATPTAPAAPPAPAVVDPLITKRVSLERAVVGDLVEYTLFVTNPNDVAILNVTVTDPLPAQVNFISGVTTAGALTFEAATRTITVVIGQMDAHQQVTITIQTRVNANGQAPDVVINTAQLTYSNLVGQGFGAASNPASLRIIPSQLPPTGYGPGPREWAELWAAAGLALLIGLGGAVRVWSRRR